MRLFMSTFSVVLFGSAGGNIISISSTSVSSLSSILISFSASAAHFFDVALRCIFCFRIAAAAKIRLSVFIYNSN